MGQVFLVGNTYNSWTEFRSLVVKNPPQWSWAIDENRVVPADEFYVTMLVF